MVSKWHFRVRREATLLPAWGVTESLMHTDKALNFPFHYDNARYINYEWLMAMEEENKLQELLKEKLKENPDYFHDYIKRQKAYGENLKRYINEIVSKKHSEKELKVEIKTYLDKMLGFYDFWWLAVPSGRFLEEEIKKILAKYGKENYFGELIRSSEMLELSKDQIELLNIGKEINGKKIGELSNVQKKKLEEHVSKFGWLSTSYHIGDPQTLESLYEKIQKSNPAKEIKELEEKENRYKIIFKELSKLLSPKEMEMIQIMQEVIFSRNYEKESVNECQHRSEPFLKRCSEYAGIPFEDFLYLTPKEVIEAVNNRKHPDKKELSERKKSYMIIVEDGKCFLSQDKKYLINPEERDDYQGSSQVIKGQPACKGKVVGKVRVIMSKEELNKFEEREILVTSMTTIDYVPMMKKAAGIITNEGGITCHAAIVSRELNVPCIIGTKNATKILKNGDIVEVDADKGIVRIIK